LRTVNGKKKKKEKKRIPNYWLMRLPGIEILLNFVPNPRKISPFSKKKLS